MKRKLFFYVISGLIIYACGKDDSPTDLQDDILGKWELTQSGNGNNLFSIENPTEYEEYQPDSIMRIFNYEEKRFFNQKYSINDSLLTKEFTYIDPIDKDTIILSEPYKYEFLNRNKLRLNFLYPAIQTTFIYKRIN